MAIPSSREDVWGSVLFDASYGGMPLDMLSTKDVAGRRLVRHRYPHRDGAELEDMGKVPKATRARILFFSRKGKQANPAIDLKAFLAVVDDARPHLFTHPLTGSYMARVGEITVEAEANKRSQIEIECTFEEDTLTPAILEFDSSLGNAVDMSDIGQSRAALTDVAATLAADRKAKLSARQYAIFMEKLSGVLAAGDGAVVRAASWDEPFKRVRDANLELAQSINELDQAQARLDAFTDVRFYPVITACNDLKLSLLQRWHGTQKAAKIIQITVAHPSPLYSIVTQLYGANDCETRVNQIRSLNDIRNPFRVDEGTVLNCQSPSVPLPSQPRNGSTPVPNTRVPSRLAG